MARTEKNRKIEQPPLMKGYKPFGMPQKTNQAVCLTFEEYESIRLVLYCRMSQQEAADLMRISRPTLTRIYNRALYVISCAIVEGRTIRIEGGNYEMDQEWFRCRRCHKLICGIENHDRCKGCPDFGKEELIRLNA